MLKIYFQRGLGFSKWFESPRSTRPLTRSRIGAKLHRLADKLSDLRTLIKLGYKLMDLRAWGVPGSDLRAWGMISERKLMKVGDPVRPGP